jgi:hypothetical protein
MNEVIAELPGELPGEYPAINLAPEQRLILECSRTSMGPRQINRVKSIIKLQLNWDLIINTAYRNGVLPVVSANLLNKFSAGLPPEIRAGLIRQFQEHTRNNLYLTARLLEIVRTLIDAGIPVLPFKGPSLAMHAYGNLSLRKFVDLDILVQPKHFDQAVRFLTENGYKAISKAPLLKRKALFFARQKDIGLVSDDLKVRVELHWKLSGSHFALPFELNQLWERLEEITLGGMRLNNLAFTDLFIYLCLHGSRHGWERLAWICDLHELIHSEKKSGRDIDWKAVRLHAQKYGCEKVVELGLFLLDKLFETKTKYPGWDQIKTNEIFKDIFNQIQQKIFSNTADGTEIGDWYWYHLALKERKLDRLKLHFHYFFWYAGLAFKPRELDKAVFRLPTIFYPLYFALRPLRLLYSYFPLSNGKKNTLF